MQTVIDNPLERYVTRLLPPSLRPGAPVPETWAGSAAEWADIRQAAEAAFRSKCALDFATAVAEKGFRAHEVASGQLDGGAEVGLMTGAVRRAEASSLDEATMREAQRVLDDLARERISINAVLMGTLEQAAAGRWRGQPQAVESALREAASALVARQAEVEAAAAEAQVMSTLVVSVPCRVTGGVELAPGTYTVTPEKADELRTWLTIMEAEAAQRGWEKPEGFAVWPPFVLTP